MKRKVRHHTSVVIIEREEGDRFMFHQYDETYPRISMRGRANLIGGNFNPEKKTYSPEQLLYQELIEEFSVKQEEFQSIEPSLKTIIGEGKANKIISKFAPEKDISLFLKTILMKAESYQDFIYTMPPLDGKPGFEAVISVYLANIPDPIFNLMEKYIIQGKAIRNEGLTIVLNTNQLKSSHGGFAWATSCVMEDYLNIKIPNHYNVKIEKIGLPRNSFVDYAKDFEYAKPVI